MQKHAAQYILVLLVLGLLLLLESKREFGGSIDDRFVSWLAANTQHEVNQSPVLLVEINDSSLSEKHSWPWSPLDYALFFQAILPLKPGIIAVEPPLTWDRNHLSKDDLAQAQQYETILHNLLLSTPKALIGAQLGFPEDPAMLPPMLASPLIHTVKGRTNDIPEFTDVPMPPAEDLRLAATIGFIPPPAPGTVTSKIPLLFRYRGELVPSFVLQSMMLWLKLAPEQISVVTGSHIALGDKISVPIDRTGSMWVDFQSPVTRFGCDELLLAVELKRAGQQVDIPLDKIAGSITLLARTDASSQVLPWPGNRKGSSGELLATAIATIQNKAFIHRIPMAIDCLLLALAVALGWFMSRQSKASATVVCVTALTVYLLGGLMIFESTRLALPLFMPAGLLAFAWFFRLCAPASQEPSRLESRL